MSDDKHSRSATKGELCGNAVSGGKCSCSSPNDYQENGKAPASWGVALKKDARGALEFLTKGKGKNNSGRDERRFEAHHLLCVSPVNAEITGNTEIDQLVRNTRWCVNDKGNMMPMPMMAHTVYWYSMLGQLTPPPFQNLPQHDWDHIHYVREVTSRLQIIARGGAAKKKGHEVESKDLQSDLKTSSRTFRKLLELRGLRNSGTHAARSAGECAPFSMASTALVMQRPFPKGMFDEKVRKWFEKISGAKP